MSYNLFTAWRKRPCGRGSFCQMELISAVPARTARQLPKALIAAAVVFGAGVAARASNHVQVEVRGVIEKECSIIRGRSASVDFSLGDISSSGSKEISYTINCNTPFKYSITSENGGLQNSKIIQTAPGFEVRLPYNIAVHIPTDDVIIDDHCASETVRIGHVACQFSDSRNGIAVDSQARVTMTWIQQKQLAAGRYFDNIVLTIAAKF